MRNLSDVPTKKLEEEMRRRNEEERQTLPFVGESIHRARYRITFEPVEAEFSDEDGARDAIHHSAWGEDREFVGAKIEKRESTVPPKDYPWICECGDCVSKTTEGRCTYCSAVKWTKRKDVPPENVPPVDWEAFSLCPTCGEKRTTTCRCPRSDSKCPNGHQWHLCTIHKKVVLGGSDHSTDTFTCTCGAGSHKPGER